MPTLPDFRLETYFSRWEFKAKYHLTASDAQTMSLSELLATGGWRRSRALGEPESRLHRDLRPSRSA